MKVSNESGDKFDIGRSLSALAYFYYFQNKKEKSLEYYLKDRDIWIELGQTRKYISSLNNIGTIYEDWGRYEKAHHA